MIAPSVKGKKGGDGDGRRSGDDGDVNGMTSSGDVDSERVEAALLAVGSQHLHQSRRTGDNDLPVSSGPPIQHADRPYGLVRQRQRRGRLKIERIKVSQMPECKLMTHLGCVYTMQPPGNCSERAYRVCRPRRQRGRIKIVPSTNVSRTRNGANAYLECHNAIRSIWRPKEHVRRLGELTVECRMQGERLRGDGDYG